MPQYTRSKSLLEVDFIKAANVIIDIPRMRWFFAESSNEIYEFQNMLPVPTTEPTLDIASSTSLKDNDEVSTTTMSAKQKSQVQRLIMENESIFRPFDEPTPYAEHSIRLTEAQPMSVPPYRMSPAQQAVLRKELDQMLQNDVIEECESPYSAPIVLVPKKNGSLRVCIDYRALNRITVADRYPLPQMDDLLQAAGPTPLVSSHQIEIKRRLLPHSVCFVSSGCLSV